MIIEHQLIVTQTAKAHSDSAAYLFPYTVFYFLYCPNCRKMNVGRKNPSFCICRVGQFNLFFFSSASYRNPKTPRLQSINGTCWHYFPTILHTRKCRQHNTQVLNCTSSSLTLFSKACKKE